MREGVIIDMKRQEMKRRQNIQMLEDQAKLTKQLRAMQQQQQTDTDTVSDVART